MRRRSVEVRIGEVRFGGGAPIVVEAMAKKGFDEMEEEIEELEEAGAELVRVAVNSKSDVDRFLRLSEEVKVALMADVHFSWDLARVLVESDVRAVRINPGNMALEGRSFERFASSAAEKGVVVRVGSNSGSAGLSSLPRRKRVGRLAELVLTAAERLSASGIDSLIVGAKSSDIRETYEATVRIAKACEWPLHIGITATGGGVEALCRSSIAIGMMLMRGLGDGVRVSLCGGSVEEVRVAKAILQSVGARRFAPQIIACPTCTRCRVDLPNLREQVEAALIGEDASLTVAVMGCVVNGPGEASHADFGLAFSGKTAVVFARGQIVRRVRRGEAIEALLEVIRGRKQ